MEMKHFPTFYRTNVKRIYRFLYFRLKGNKASAEDLTQDVFLKAYGAFESYDPRVSQSSWIFTIARNTLINHVKKQRPSANLEDIENTIWDREPWDERMTVKYDVDRLENALATLPEEDRQVVQLKHIEGWSFDEISQLVGKNAATLRVQSFRALKRLQAILKQK